MCKNAITWWLYPSKRLSNIHGNEHILKHNLFAAGSSSKHRQISVLSDLDVLSACQASFLIFPMPVNDHHVSDMFAHQILSTCPQSPFKCPIAAYTYSKDHVQQLQAKKSLFMKHHTSLLKPAMQRRKYNLIECVEHIDFCHINVIRSCTVQNREVGLSDGQVSTWGDYRGRHQKKFLLCWNCAAGNAVWIRSKISIK